MKSRVPRARSRLGLTRASPNACGHRLRAAQPAGMMSIEAGRRSPSNRARVGIVALEVSRVGTALSSAMV